MLKEAMLRLRILAESPEACDPARYGHPLVGDDYWILAGRWNTFHAPINPHRIHPRLGWSQGPISAENPLGLEPRTNERMQRNGRPKVAFYGDSYVNGAASQPCWLPTLIEERLGGTHVLNLGVGGYCPGQMHLLMEETLRLMDGVQLILMGVESFSFDRAALGVRSYQKPRLVVSNDGTLGVENLPIDPDPEHFYRHARLSFRSFLKREKHLQEQPPEATHYDYEAKVAINRAIIEANQRTAATYGARLIYVLFHDLPQLTAEHARSQFFLRETRERGIDVFDTREALRPYLDLSRDIAGAPGPRGASDLYAQGHLNDDGNRIVARAIAEHISKVASDLVHRHH